MKKGKKSRPAPSAPTAVNIGDLTLKLEPDTNLRVTVISPEKAPQPLNRMLLALIVVVIATSAALFFLNVMYVVPTDFPPPIEFSGPPVSVSLTCPTYVAFKDEAEMALMVTNRSAESYTGNLTVIFKGKVPASPLPDGTTTLKIDKMAAGASHSYRLKFALCHQTQFFCGETIQTVLQLAGDKHPMQALDGPLIRIAPLPMIRTAMAWLSSSAALLAVAALVWEVTRKRLLGWEAQ
ncbi:MAG TPA: hypothetical protein VJ302_37595 [Blastocatellia bacterium]|nr:hypothetical protein [Blastocatellia bacterium]